ncbi:hypothetical protein BGW39_010177 [Mortierella sp. 14UC]|nr:hypothetical protein BGW39_010177 [Mortierella sp. 14UC]
MTMSASLATIIKPGATGSSPSVSKQQQQKPDTLVTGAAITAIVTGSEITTPSKSSGEDALMAMLRH